MPRSFVLVYIAARLDAPDDLLRPFPAAEFCYEDDVKGFRVAMVPREHAGRLLDRLREAGALYAPASFRFIYPTLQAAINNAEAHAQGGHA